MKRLAGSPADATVTKVVDAAPPEREIVKSAARALQILEMFDEVRRHAKVSEISERLGYPQSSTSALLKSLTFLGYLNYDRHARTYIPSPRVAMLGAWLEDRPVRDGSFIRMLEYLWQESGQTIIVASRNGIYSQYIHVLQATTPRRFYVPRGSRRFLCWSATGFALLSGSEDDEVRALVRRTNAERREHEIIPAPVVLENIRHVLDKGYSFSRGLVTQGAGSIAMCLPDWIDASRRPLALGMSGPLEHLADQEKQLVEMMRDAIATYLPGEAAYPASTQHH